MMPSLRVGFAGLGLMGRPMALNLLADGHAVRFVINRDRSAVAELLAAGGQERATPAALAADCEVLMLCLPGSEVIERVLFGEQGAVHGGMRDLLVVDCSTSPPLATQAIAARLAAKGIRFVDAPVVRGPREAAKRRLAALAGGSDDDLVLARRVLASFCETVVHIGGVGAGQQAKLINNFLALGGLALVAEAHAVALRLGLDPARLCEAVTLGGGNSRVFQAMIPWITERDERRAQATLGTALKDVSYYAQLAGEAGGPDQLARQVREQFSGAVEGGFGERFIPHLLDFVAGRQP
ncbi:MAG: NAD(P)-dependent oxidoreductase [Burkholderiaceae bacterium]|nr:NAD(P)-dependent oxidoreductase [Burkholderiaceae bacterium]